MPSDSPTRSPQTAHDGAQGRRGAFIGASVGALVGGLFSLGATWLTLHDQARREGEAQRRVAVGTARVMIGAFDNAVIYLCRLGKENKFLVITPHLRPEVATADRTLVAGELTAREALDVSEGDMAMANWEGLYRKHREEFAGREETFDPYRAGLHRGIARAMQARTALEGVAEYDPGGRVVCDTEDWELDVPD